jgi:hypothetical protein
MSLQFEALADEGRGRLQRRPPRRTAQQARTPDTRSRAGFRRVGSARSRTRGPTAASRRAGSHVASDRLRRGRLPGHLHLPHMADGAAALLDGRHNLHIPERALQREFHDQVQDAAPSRAAGARPQASFWETAGMTKIPPAPAWTDHNTSDPGITVLEVLAYSVAALVGVALVSRHHYCRRRLKTGQ